MYFQYVVNWLYRCMQVPVPIVVSNNVYGLVTIFDLFLFTVYLGVFIVLIKYLITDNIDIKLGDTDVNYSSSSYITKQYNRSLSNYIKANTNRRIVSDKKKADYLKGQQWLNERKNKAKTYSDSIGGRILAKKNAGRIARKSEK